MKFLDNNHIVNGWVHVDINGVGATSDIISMKNYNHCCIVLDAETRRIYDLLGESDGTAETRRLVEWIERHGGVVTPQDVQQGNRQYKTADEATAALNLLVQAKMGKWETIAPTEKGGRACTRFVLFKPAASTEPI